MLGAIGLVLALTIGAAPAQANAADTISADRATVREYPGRLVLANAAAGDPADVTAYCGEWVRVRLTPRHKMATPIGWVMRGHLTQASRPGGLDGVPEQCGTDSGRWRDWVGAINAPFHSLRQVDGAWRRIVFGTGVTLAASPDCVPSMNYVRHSNAPDAVDPAQRVTGLDLSKVSYRYVTRDISGLDTGVGYSNATIRARGCTGALRGPTRPNFGYWPDPEAGNRPPCPV